MRIGDYNLFEVGCREFPLLLILLFHSCNLVSWHLSMSAPGIESPSIGSHNNFEPRARVTELVTLLDFCTVGAGCSVLPPATWDAEDESQAQSPKKREKGATEEEEGKVESEGEGGEQSRGVEPKDIPRFLVPSRTVVFGEESRWRTWSGEGIRQADALHAKHLDYLRQSEFASTNFTSTILPPHVLNFFTISQHYLDSTNSA